MLKPVIVCRAYFVVEDRKELNHQGDGERGYCNTLVRKKENSVNVQF